MSNSVKNSIVDTRLFDSAPSLYVLQKRFSYWFALHDYYRWKLSTKTFNKPVICPDELNKALFCIVKYIQKKYFGDVISRLTDDSLKNLLQAI